MQNERKDLSKRLIDFATGIIRLIVRHKKVLLYKFTFNFALYNFHFYLAACPARELSQVFYCLFKIPLNFEQIRFTLGY